MTAALAIALDALSFAVSALCLGLIRTPEPAPAPARQHQQRALWHELGEGLRVVLGTPLLRTLAAIFGTHNLFAGMLVTRYVLYVTRDLGIAPATLGVIGAVGSLGALVGAVVAGRAVRRFGLGVTIVGGGCLVGLAGVVFLLACGSPAVIIALLVTAELLSGLGAVLVAINVESLRQAIIPDQVQWRVTASWRVVILGTVTVGALLGGVLGDGLGLWPMLAVGVLGQLLASIALCRSPVRTLREPPQPDGLPHRLRAG